MALTHTHIVRGLNDVKWLSVCHNRFVRPSAIGSVRPSMVGPSALVRAVRPVRTPVRPSTPVRTRPSTRPSVRPSGPTTVADVRCVFCYDQWSGNELPSIRKVFDLLLPPSPSRYRLSSAFVVCSIKHSRFPNVIERKFCLLADCRLLLDIGAPQRLGKEASN